MNTISEKDSKFFYRPRNLPHLFDIHKPVFITFRLKFTLLQSIIDELTQRKIEWQNAYDALDDKEKAAELKKKDAKYFHWFDVLIAKSKETPIYLSNPVIAAFVSEALHYHDNERYELIAYCVIPNHVHVIIFPLLNPDGDIYPISRITYSWKRYSANKINKYLDKKGNLWQAESYDHLIQDEEEFYRVIEYVIDNPVQAGLAKHWKDWKATWVKQEYAPDE
jgi:REP element-mobilizing transposase RayT